MGENVADAAPGEVRDGVAPVANAMIGLLRMIRRNKAKVLAIAREDVDSAAQLALRTVANEGPMRASVLAVSMQTDLSTVSRQVAALVDRGLLERRADQRDGRASLLVITDEGRAFIGNHERDRQLFYQQVMDGWTTDEMASFSGLLERFTTAYEDVHSRWLDDGHKFSAAPPPARLQEVGSN